MKIQFVQSKTETSPFNFIDMNRIRENFELTDKDPDFYICLNSIPTGLPHEKIVLIQKESPLTQHRIWTYENFDKFHTVIVHNPQGKNQFPFTDNPIVFPWNPRLEDWKEQNTKLRNRIIFYAGKKSDIYAKRPFRFGVHTLYDVRDKLVKSLAGNPKFVCVGRGWDNCIEGQSTRAIYDEKKDWLKAKLEDIKILKADFIICMDNCIQKGLIGDKIHSGFNSDKLVLYLGEPEIEKYVPSNCFIDLRKVFDSCTKQLYTEAILDFAQKITQEEYDNYIKNAREWRKTLAGKFQKEKIKFTEFLIGRLKNG